MGSQKNIKFECIALLHTDDISQIGFYIGSLPPIRSFGLVKYKDLPGRLFLARCVSYNDDSTFRVVVIREYIRASI